MIIAALKFTIPFYATVLIGAWFAVLIILAFSLPTVLRNNDKKRRKQ